MDINELADNLEVPAVLFTRVFVSFVLVFCVTNWCHMLTLKRIFLYHKYIFGRIQHSPPAHIVHAKTERRAPTLRTATSVYAIVIPPEHIVNVSLIWSVRIHTCMID